MQLLKCSIFIVYYFYRRPLKNITNNEFTSEDSIAFPNNDDQYSLHTPNLSTVSTLINNNNANNATNMYGYPEPVTVTNNVTIER